MSTKRLEVGEIVYAKWPGSHKYFEAVLVKKIDETNCVVNFKDGQLETEVALRDVHNARFFQRKSRSVSPTRRARSRSPGRRRSRSRSPARKSVPASPGTASPRRGRPPGQPKKEAVKPSPKPSPKITRANQKPKEEKLPETPARVTRSLTKMLIKEEKEALLGAEMEDDVKEKARKTGRREYEFGGPLGVFLMMLGLPAVLYAFHFYCHGNDGQCSFLQKTIAIPTWQSFFNREAHLVFDSWILFQAILYVVPFGRVAQGTPLADGSTRLEYRISGFFALLASIAVFCAAMVYKLPVTFIYYNFPSLITASVIWSVIISIFVYILARKQGTGLSPGGNTGNVVYDFFMGHQLNPRIGKFDFKYFFEIRPGLIAWIMINFCMAVKEAEVYGKASPAMIMVCVFQFVYVADCLIFEASLLTTFDITREGFGFMLGFGDIAFVPFMYTLQARFLVDHRVNLHWAAIVAIVLLKVIGYVIFRGANLQKDFFRRNPNDPDFKDQETILTPSGRRLMVFGWWGLVRHPNYLGDILMAISWSLTCGFTHIIPWFYAIFLTVLLVHREFRDEANCRTKYGRSWDEYCRRVPYRIFPNIF